MTERLERMLRLVRTRVPGLTLLDKRGVPWMRCVARVLRPWVPDFDTNYTTVFGRRIYLPVAPDEMRPEVLTLTLAHELVHQLDQRRWGIWFYVSYALCLPTGRTFRAFWERRAYGVDLLIAKEKGGEPELERAVRGLVSLFSGRSYLWMWAGRRAARRFLEPTVEAVREGTLAEREPYASILATWRGDVHGRD